MVKLIQTSIKQMGENVNSIIDRYSKLIVKNSSEFLFAYTSGQIKAREEDIPVFVTEIKKYLKQMVNELNSQDG